MDGFTTVEEPKDSTTLDNILENELDMDNPYTRDDATDRLLRIIGGRE